MATRPQNIGIKAVEIYFPNQVRANIHTEAEKDLEVCSEADYHTG